jgi:hypothetical protein
MISPELIEIHIRPSGVRTTQRIGLMGLVSHALERTSRRSSGLLAALLGRRRGIPNPLKEAHQHQTAGVNGNGREVYHSGPTNSIKAETAAI